MSDPAVIFYFPAICSVASTCGSTLQTVFGIFGGVSGPFSTKDFTEEQMMWKEEFKDNESPSAT